MKQICRGSTSFTELESERQAWGPRYASSFRSSNSRHGESDGGHIESAWVEGKRR
ncbi:uncharacterized protein G2W53_037616 [Senna tora]|uniref:Uncharacterized protein n=1 Tax=Senna tora TaxID=362788 RepID=A0A834SMY4_9FABA|nr:uncharacterized protein G2W53_037616 [Senna tora]